jgi:hypothetical protein
MFSLIGVRFIESCVEGVGTIYLAFSPSMYPTLQGNAAAMEQWPWIGSGWEEVAIGGGVLDAAPQRLELQPQFPEQSWAARQR